MSTYTTTVLPQTGDLPSAATYSTHYRASCWIVETLHDMSGTAWAAERCTAYERDVMVLATKYVTGMMIGLGLWERSTPQRGE